MKKVIIDTDPGIGAVGADIDDGLAIVMALNSPELNVLGLTIVNGNVSCEVGTTNALNLLEVMERPDIPVYKGLDRPLVGDMEHIRETFAIIQERSGWQTPIANQKGALREQPMHAVDFIAEQALRYPGEVTVICIGPLTNLAMALRKEPNLHKTLKAVIIMGGGWTQPLDCMTPVAEFNMFCDPEAAKIVLHSGIPLYMTGYDLSKKTMLLPSHLETIRQHQTPTSEFIHQMAKPWLAFMDAAFGLKLCYLPDPQAIALAVDPKIFHMEEMYVDIELKGELTRGMTVADRNMALRKCNFPPNVNVCTELNIDKFMDLMIQRLR